MMTSDEIESFDAALQHGAKILFEVSAHCPQAFGQGFGQQPGKLLDGWVGHERLIPDAPAKGQHRIASHNPELPAAPQIGATAPPPALLWCSQCDHRATND